jgi:predicted O-linked N-acetylglucosamine transferase (SPINDLY family)
VTTPTADAPLDAVALDPAAPESVLAAAERALAADPHEPKALVARARALIALDRLDEAEAALEAASTIARDASAVAMTRAFLAHRRADEADFRSAVAALAAAHDANPAAFRELSVALDRRGAGAASIAVLEAGLSRFPADGDVAFALGLALARGGEFDRAAAPLAAALEAAPRDLERNRAMIDLLISTGQAERARSLAHAIAGGDRRSAAHARLLLETLRKTGADEPLTLAQARHVATLVGGAAGAMELADEHRRLWDFAAVHRALDEALRADPEFAIARWQKALVPDRLPFADDASERAFAEGFRSALPELRAIVEHATADELRGLLDWSSAFFVHYTGHASRDDLAAFGDLVHRAAAPFAPDPPRIPESSRGRRIRVGVCSSFLYGHTVTKLFGGLIGSLDPERFEVHLFHPGGFPDAVTEALRARAASYRCGPGDAAEWARVIAHARLDVLVYPEIGMDPLTVTLAAMRLAPTQAVLWGHPVTTGLPTVDLFLSSDAMEPADGAAQYRERLVRLPGLGAAPAPPRAKPRRPPDLAPARSGDVLVFMPQMLQKFGPAFDRVLARIAAREPRVRYLFTPFMHRRPTIAWLRRLERAFADAGADLRRHLHFCGWVDQDEWLALVEASDFALDSFRWSGGNTTLEILALDRPVLTLPADTMRGRHTAAMLERLELPELIAADEEDFVARAVELARSPTLRAELGAKIAERKQRLYDARAVERAFAEVLSQAVGERSA